MKKTILSIFFLSFTIFTMLCDETATTVNGRKVLLKDDGTWEWKNEVTSGEIYGYTKPETSKAKIIGKKNKYHIWYNEDKWNAKRKPGISEYYLENTDNTIYAMVIPEKKYINIDVLLEAALINARNAADRVEVLEKEERIVNGKKIMYMKMKASIKEMDFVYLGYYYSHQDFGSIQILTYTLAAFQEQSQQEMEDFLNGVEFTHK